MLSREQIDLVNSHPCFDEKAHFRRARVHLPVAVGCNIQCKFCDRKVSEYYHTSRPGLSSILLEPHEVVNAIESALRENPSLSVVGISGPGEPLFNENTFKTLEIVGEHFPQMNLCVCTNGLLLPKKAGLLWGLNVKFLTVTVNAVDAKIASKISSYCYFEGKEFHGGDAGELLVSSQLEGLKIAHELGFVIKVNTVLIPGINDSHVADIAKVVKSKDAHMLNIMPLIPLGKFSNLRAPTCQDLIAAREKCEQTIPIFRACKQCRADACGVPGQADASDMLHLL